MSRARCVARIWLGVGMALAAPAGAAPGEGFYCTGDGYLAWQTHGARADPAQRLAVIEFDGARGIGPLTSTDLPDFEIEGMRCDRHEITLYGADAAHRIAIENGMARYVGSVRPSDLDALARRHAARRFGDTPELDLEVDDRTGRYVLLTDLGRRRFEQGDEFTTFVRLVRLGNHGLPLDNRVIFVESTIEAHAGDSAD